MDDVPRPSPGDGEVLVRVIAASVNPVDWKYREGQYPTLPVPFITGGDFSGTIEATGPGVSAFRVGDAVFGGVPGSTGSHAEFVVVPVGAIAPKPRSLDHIQAASVPLTAMTAWQGLFDQGKLAPGEHVLILGGSGGVGSLAVQLAKNAKARVLATASTENVARVRELGADFVIDYRKQHLRDAGEAVDLVLDLVGGDSRREAFDVVRRGGRLVTTVMPPPDEGLARARGVTAVHFRQQFRGDDLREIARQIDAGSVRITVAKVLPLERAAEAEELNRKKQVSGKIVLRVAA
ncbi:MAG TPA: NADP-dependent oxidoreductase, partial [Planctomycetota bacterium]|nr:NADP-dependent oxidoreductase [Planctomycetota bacterium]